MAKEGVNFVGAMKAGSGKGSLHDETRFAFGEKVVGGRKVSAVDSTGELDAKLRGDNAMGPPEVDHLDASGNPVFRRDAKGHVIHGGAKLVKFDNNTTPTHVNNPKPAVDLRAVDGFSKRYTGEGLWGDEPDDSWKGRK